MESLGKEIPSLATEFRKGHFVVQKSYRAFSSIPIDQAHEQNNKVVKGDGGAIGLTENACKSSEELTKKKQSEGSDLRHHEQIIGVQATFQKQVKALCAIIEDMGNPVLKESEDLLVLDTRDIMDSSVAEAVRKIDEIGKTQFEAFVTERLQQRTVSLFDPILRETI